MKKAYLIIAIFGAMCVTTAHAREFADIYTDCGIGAMIAPNNDAVAAVTNVTWDLGTTAISSNISSEDSCAGGKSKTAAFIFDSYPQLEKDLAIGSGEYLTALMQINNVPSTDIKATAAAIRTGFAELVTAENYVAQTRYEKAERLFTLLYRNIG